MRHALSAWGLVLALFGAALYLAPPPPTGAEGSSLARLLAPVLELAADLEWIGFQSAQRDGRPDRAIARAERALALAPRDPSGWELLIAYLGLDLASPERELDGAKRVALVRAAVGVSLRGESVAAHPEELAFARGVLLMTRAEFDPGLPWPGGLRELWSEAADAFDAASRGGYAGAAELAVEARRNAEQ